jgi:hypothetical protein
MMDELMHHLVEGIGMVPEVVQALMQLGYHSVEHIATATAEELAQVPDLEGQDAMKMVELARTIMDQKSAGTYVSPFDTSSQDDANQEVDEESKEDEGNDLSYLGPLADLGPIPDAKPDDVVSAEESPAPHADEV